MQANNVNFTEKQLNYLKMKSVIICDMEGIILKMNKGAADMFGYNPNELIGNKRVSLFLQEKLYFRMYWVGLKKQIKMVKILLKLTLKERMVQFLVLRLQLPQILRMEKISRKLVTVV